MHDINHQQKQMYHEVINSMIAVIEALDPYTRDHSRNVANYALLLAEELKLSSDDIHAVYYGALFHDIGKIGIAPDILKKPSSLTPQEFEQIKTHPVKGAHIIAQITDFVPFVPIIKYHHEHFDGSGYPEGLVGEQIPLGARIVAVTDAYDALTTNRTYRSAQEKKAAINEIKNCASLQFDPDIVTVFLSIVQHL